MGDSQPHNPFSPTFGSTPPLLAGRDQVLGRFSDALDAGPTHPDYTLLVTGNRGTGKTALLNVLEAQAADRGWMFITASASAEPVSARIASEAQRCLAQMRKGRGSTRLSSVSMMGIGVSLDPGPQEFDPASGLLAVLEELGELLADKGGGLLLTVDELHDVDRDDVRNVASAVQIVTRRRQRPVAFAAAALPLIEDTHLADPNMTFLQRCARARLGFLDEEETKAALRQPVLDSGGAIDDDALAEAVALTLGYPYMIQLVGFHAWQMRDNLRAPINLTNVRAGGAEAEMIMVDQIAGPTWNRLSAMDRRFLIEMLADEPDSSLADIAMRLGRSLQYARTYRRRLVAAGAISISSKGRVRFLHHAFRSKAEAAARQE